MSQVPFLRSLAPLAWAVALAAPGSPVPDPPGAFPEIAHLRAVSVETGAVLTEVLCMQGGFAVARADEDGLITVPAGTPTFPALELRARGYATLEVELTGEGADPDAPRVVPLFPAAALRLAVVDAAGEPAAGLDVSVRYLAQIEWPVFPPSPFGLPDPTERMVRTDDAGRATFDELPCWQLIEVRVAGADGGVPRDAWEVQLAPREERSVRRSLPERRPIRGRVVDEQGAGLAGVALGVFTGRPRFAEASGELAWVSVRDAPRLLARAQSDDAGAFAFEEALPVRPGGFWVGVVSPASWPMPFRSPLRASPGARELTVPEEGGVRLVVPRAAAVTGLLRWPEARPFEDERPHPASQFVRLRHLDSGWSAEVQADGDSRFLAAGMPPGTYTVEAGGYSCWSIPRRVEVDPGERVDVGEVVLAARGDALLASGFDLEFDRTAALRGEPLWVTQVGFVGAKGVIHHGLPSAGSSAPLFPLAHESEVVLRVDRAGGQFLELLNTSRTMRIAGRARLRLVIPDVAWLLCTQPPSRATTRVVVRHDGQGRVVDHWLDDERPLWVSIPVGPSTVELTDARGEVIATRALDPEPDSVVHIAVPPTDGGSASDPTAETETR